MSSISNLHNNILEEIFCKLPITTLIQCRYVCKSWKNILANLNFAKLHQQRTEVLLCVQELKQRYIMYWLEFQGKSSYCNLNTSFKHRYWSSFRREFINSCNGLVCLLKYDPNGRVCNAIMQISNPLTGEYMNFPLLDEKKFLHEYICGLGFSPNSNQFMAIRITYFRESYMRGNSEALAEVYTLGTVDESWRSVGFAPRYDYLMLPSRFFCNRNLFVKQSLHWLVRRREDTIASNLEICTFNFDTEQFRTFHTPPQVQALRDNECSILDFSTLGDSLCMYLQARNELKIDIWLMKEYGIAESWTKICVIEDSHELQLNNFLKNGDILLVRKNMMFLYSPGNKIFTEVDTHGVIIHNGEIGKIGCGTCFVHKPSFVSLKDMVGLENTLRS